MFVYILVSAGQGDGSPLNLAGSQFRTQEGAPKSPKPKAHLGASEASGGVIRPSKRNRKKETRKETVQIYIYDRRRGKETGK